MPGVSGRLTHFVFRLRHDCPVARLSADLPEVLFRSWSGHRREIIHARADGEVQQRVIEAFKRRLPTAMAIPFKGGVAAIYESEWPKKESISRQLEDHSALWLQPLQYQSGWEYYDVVSLDDAALQRYLTDLLKKFKLEILSRGTVDETAILSAFFVPLNPVLSGLTRKQEEALLAAWREGYYEQPRNTTTRDVAKVMGISRSAFEERLRKAENLVIQGVAPALASSGKPATPPQA
jgi:predicted DNA binding protein